MIDAVGLIGATLATATTIKLVRQMSRTTTRSMFQILQSLSRQQRKPLMEELIRANNPGISNTTLKAIMRTGKVPKQLGDLLSADDQRQTPEMDCLVDEILRVHAVIARAVAALRQ